MNGPFASAAAVYDVARAKPALDAQWPGRHYVKPAVTHRFGAFLHPFDPAARCESQSAVVDYRHGSAWKSALVARRDAHAVCRRRDE
jgi:hypothetical protein